MEHKAFVLVEFPEENNLIELIRNTWITDGDWTSGFCMVRFPSNVGDFDRILQEKITPDQSWGIFPANVIGSRGL